MGKQRRNAFGLQGVGFPAQKRLGSRDHRRHGRPERREQPPSAVAAVCWDAERNRLSRHAIPGNHLHQHFRRAFFEKDGTVFKLSPETGDIEPVCAFGDFDPACLDDFWTGESLKRAWEDQHGQLGPNHCLVPVIPFILGGAFEPQNLMALPLSEANTFYAAIRAGIQSLDDGEVVHLEVAP